MASTLSVIIPFYNGRAFLPDALQSLFAQTRKADEILLIDDGSSEPNATWAKELRSLRYLVKANGGVASARNFGLAHAQGDYLAFLDQDDQWSPDKLKLQTEILDSHPEVDLVLGQSRHFLDKIHRPEWCRPELLEKNQYDFVPGVLLARRKVFERVGKFSTDFKLADDLDWMTRALNLGVTMAYCPQVLLYRRIHASNQSADGVRSNHEILAVLRRSVLRRRRHFRESVCQ